MKIPRLLLLGFVGAGLLSSSNKAYSQLNVEFQKQQSKKHLCESSWWPDAQYEHRKLSHESRILIKDNNVFRISFKKECKSEFIGHVNKDYNYSPNKIVHFTPNKEELIEYYKNPNSPIIRKRSHAKRLQSNKSSGKQTNIFTERLGR